MLPLIYGARAVEPDLGGLARTAAEERRFGARAFAADAVWRGLLRLACAQRAWPSWCGC